MNKIRVKIKLEILKSKEDWVLNIEMGFKKNSDTILHTNQEQGLKFKPCLWYLLKYILVESRRDGGGCVWEEGRIACARLVFQLRRLE